MLEGVAAIFENKEKMMRNLKKRTYEEYMHSFREKHGHYFEEMTGYIENASDQETALVDLSKVFTEAVFEAFSKKGKIRGTVQVDLNFFMIYYVLPAILLTENANAEKIAQAICNQWAATFADSNISYTTYENIHSKFREKIFGIF